MIILVRISISRHVCSSVSDNFQLWQYDLILETNEILGAVVLKNVLYIFYVSIQCYSKEVIFYLDTKKTFQTSKTTFSDKNQLGTTLFRGVQTKRL